MQRQGLQVPQRREDVIRYEGQSVRVQFDVLDGAAQVPEGRPFDLAEAARGQVDGLEVVERRELIADEGVDSIPPQNQAA